MRKLIYFFAAVIAIAVLSPGNEAYGQMNRRTVKRNNRRISHYKGRKSHFGKEKRYNMVGFSLSALNYYGDLAPRPSRFSTDISFTRPAIGLSFTHRFGPRYSLTGNFMYGTLKGSDHESADKHDATNGMYRYDRNLSFRNRIKEFSVVATFDLWQNMSTYISRVKWTPYAFLGIAGFFHNPQAKAPKYEVDGVTPLKEAGRWVDLQPLGTEGQHSTLQKGDVNYGIHKYHKFQPAIPYGIGVRIRLNQVMDFAAELGFRYTFTDYLDDVSKNYVDLGVFKNNELAKAMSYRTNEVVTPTNPTYVGRDGKTYLVLDGYGREYKENKRGDKKSKDTYMVTTFKLTYIIGKTFHRAKFR
jgi:hypothetical protein